jgi:hypothetical protein
MNLAQEPREVSQVKRSLQRNDAPPKTMLFADVSNWTRAVESPNLDVSQLVFAQVSCEYERLTFRAAEFKIPEHENNSTAFHD